MKETRQHTAGRDRIARSRYAELKQMLDARRRERALDRDERAPATEYRFADGIGRVGFIASVSRPFCLNCNRLRITADGQLRYCLFAVEETDIRALIRRNAPEEEIAAAIAGSVHDKWLGHEINSARFVAPPRPMYSIGG